MKLRTQTVADLVARIQAADADEFASLERALACDTRLGIIRALERGRARLEREDAERQRRQGLYSYERGFSTGTIVGLDEVGRGPLAGPLCVGAVVLPDDIFIEGLDDSKQIPEQRRREIAQNIKSAALAWTVHFVEPSEIDAMGMGKALKHAFAHALSSVEASGASIDCVLIDGNPLHIDPRERNVVKGDSLCASIAAASIVAKVERDDFMVEQSAIYPQYGFDRNKGYATEEHQSAIREFGLSPIHRRSFCSAFLQETLF